MSRKPLSRSEDLVIQKCDNELLIYDLKTNKASCLNQTAMLVWQNCNGKRSVSDIARQMERELGSEVSEDLVSFALIKLAEEDLLAERGGPNHNLQGPTRRELIRKVGLASMVALPIVSAVVVPTAAQAQSCFAPGTPLNIPNSTQPSVPACLAYCSDPAQYTQCCSGMGAPVGLGFNPGTGDCQCVGEACA